MKESKEQSGTNLETLELKANLNPEQREYLEVLKDKMKKVLGGKTKQELAKAGDLVTLKNYRAILIEILDYLRTKEEKKVNFEGKELYKSQADFLDLVARRLVKSGKKEDEQLARRFVSSQYAAENGKIIELYLDKLDLEDFPDLSELSELQYLNCSTNKLSDLPGLESLKNLTRLDCFKNNLTKLSGVQNLKRLHRLIGWDNKFDPKEKIRIENNLPKGCKIEI